MVEMLKFARVLQHSELTDEGSQKRKWGLGKGNEMEILHLKIAVLKKKNISERFNRLVTVEEKVNKLEVRSMETVQTEAGEEKE
jgi:hypothetical protein